MKRRLRGGLAGIALLSFACAFIHPVGVVKARHSVGPLLAGAETPAAVTGVLERSCQNCHSERTLWPWYSYVPPFSWLIENDVDQARKHMNLSRWQEYTTDQQVEILSRMGAEVRSRQMPVPRYLSLHPAARLSDSDVKQLYDWSHRERRRLASPAAASAQE